MMRIQIKQAVALGPHKVITALGPPTSHSHTLRERIKTFHRLVVDRVHPINTQSYADEDEDRAIAPRFRVPARGATEAVPV